MLSPRMQVHIHAQHLSHHMKKLWISREAPSTRQSTGNIGTYMYMSLPKTNTQNMPETSLTPYPSVRMHACMHRHTNEVRNSFQLRRGNNAMQCNRFRNWEGFPSYSSSRSSISNMQYIIQCNACAPEGRPTTQATTLDDLPPHQTRHLLQLPINGILQAKNNTTISLSLHTLKVSVSTQPCACHAMLFRTGMEPSSER
jgi:hypothetical protein